MSFKIERTTEDYKHTDIKNKFNDMVQTLDILDELVTDIDKLQKFRGDNNLPITNADIADCILTNFSRTLAENARLKLQIEQLKKVQS